MEMEDGYVACYTALILPSFENGLFSQINYSEINLREIYSNKNKSIQRGALVPLRG